MEEQKVLFWTYDNSIQPKGRTAKFLAERLAAEYKRLGYQTDVRQRGELWDVYTFPSAFVGAVSVSQGKI